MAWDRIESLAINEFINVECVESSSVQTFDFARSMCSLPSKFIRSLMTIRHQFTPKNPGVNPLTGSGKTIRKRQCGYTLCKLLKIWIGGRTEWSNEGAIWAVRKTSLPSSLKRQPNEERYPPNARHVSKTRRIFSSPKTQARSRNLPRA